MIWRCHTLICTVMYLISHQVAKWPASKVIVQSSSCVQHVKHLSSCLLTLVISICQVYISLWCTAQSPLTFAHIDFKDWDDWRYIKYLFHSHNADSATVNTIMRIKASIGLPSITFQVGCLLIALLSSSCIPCLCGSFKEWSCNSLLTYQRFGEAS